jgi:membrane-associated phospholipid phosphatase
MSIVDKRRYAAAAFLVLVTLSVYWPSPVVSINRLCCDARLGVDELSFLGRESPSWDVVFWFLAGVLALLIVQTGEFRPEDVRAPWLHVRQMRWSTPRAEVAFFLITIAVLVASSWLLLDATVTAWAEKVSSDEVKSVIRILNRLGGGMNPVLLVGFFLLAGIAYAEDRWVRYGVAMVVSGLSAGILVQIVKLLVGRSRPELWLGPFHHERASASSFPSGHTVSAFSLLGVLVVASPNPILRATAFLLAAAIGFSRVLAFRHWTSDVVASAAIGMFTAWVAWRAVQSGEWTVDSARKG